MRDPASMHPLPVPQLPLRVLLLNAVALLDAPDQLVALAVDESEIIVSELAPLLLHLALHLLPVAGDLVPIHLVSFPLGRTCLGNRAPRHWFRRREHRGKRRRYLSLRPRRARERRDRLPPSRSPARAVPSRSTVLCSRQRAKSDDAIASGLIPATDGSRDEGRRRIKPAAARTMSATQISAAATIRGAATGPSR